MIYNLKLINNKKLLVLLLVGIMLLVLIAILINFILKPKVAWDVVLVLLIIPVYIICYKICQSSYSIEIKNNRLLLNYKTFDFKEIESYNYASSGIVHGLILRFKNGEKVDLAISSKSSHIINYRTFVADLVKAFDLYNNQIMVPDEKILQKNIYNNKLSKPLGFIIIGFLVFSLIMFFSKSVHTSTDKISIVGYFFIGISALIRIFINKK
jgi:hypothetical protein